MNLAHGSVEFDFDPMPGHQGAERCGDGRGTTHREMHTMCAFKVVDQAVDTCGVEWVAAHQQWLNRKRLTQLWILQMAAYKLPDGIVASQAK